MTAQNTANSTDQARAVTPDQSEQTNIINLAEERAARTARPDEARQSKANPRSLKIADDAFGAAQDKVAGSELSVVPLDKARQTFRVQPGQDGVGNQLSGAFNWLQKKAQVAGVILASLFPAAVGTAGFFAPQVGLAADAEAGRVDRERPDKETIHRFDLTREGDKKPVILTLKTPSKIWRLGDHYFSERVNYQFKKPLPQGTEAAMLYYVDNPTVNGYQNKIYIFIEDMPEAEDREKPEDHLQRIVAARTTEEALREFWGNAYQEYRGSLNEPKITKRVSLGKAKVPTAVTSFNLHSENTTAENAVVRMNVVYLSVNGKLVTMAVEAGYNINVFDTLFKGLKVDDEPGIEKSDSEPVKYLEPMRNQLRFVAFNLPEGFIDRNSREGSSSTGGVWEKPEKGGDVLSRVELNFEEHPVETRLEEEVNTIRRGMLASTSISDVAEPAAIEMGRSKGYVLTFTDKSDDPPRNVRTAYVQIKDHIIRLTWTSFSSDERQLKAEDKEFKELVASAKAWAP